MAVPSFKLVVIGLGLIGGSLAAALKARQQAVEIIGVVRKQQTADYALDNKIVDRVVLSLKDIASELSAGDVIFIAVPTLSVPAAIAEIKQWVSPSVTITDGASVKGSVLDAAVATYGAMPPQFVLGHPIAGSEKSGVTAANPKLYINHRVILTPVAETGAEHVARVTTMWESVGAEVITMPVAEHDIVLAATSHLPHAIAYSLVDTLANDSENENIFRYAAGGFRDFTRIASSDPQMWHDIMLANKESVLAAIDLFQNNLLNMRAAIANQDGDSLLKIFSRAKTARDEFSRLINKQLADKNSSNKTNESH
jgi:3-phosphoshikimate 1-carboxyvinyltransferase